MTRLSLRYFAPAVLTTVCSLALGTAKAQQIALVDPSTSVAPVSYSSSMSSSVAQPGDADGQQTMPNAPTPQTEEHTDGQTKRILGIIPNFRAVSANQKLPPQSVKDKFVTASEDTFDYSSVVLPAVLAGYGQATNATPEFHQGAAAYGRYFWHSFVDQSVENYMVEFIVPTVTHEDTRYYTLGSGGFVKRTKYALTRAVITRSDSGKEVFNASEVIGAGAAAGLSTLYYPGRERSLGKVGDQWGLDVGIDAATFMFKEFWPDINHKLFHGQKEMQN